MGLYLNFWLQCSSYSLLLLFLCLFFLNDVQWLHSVFLPCVIYLCTQGLRSSRCLQASGVAWLTCSLCVMQAHKTGKSLPSQNLKHLHSSLKSKTVITLFWTQQIITRIMTLPQSYFLIILSLEPSVLTHWLLFYSGPRTAMSFDDLLLFFDKLNLCGVVCVITKLLTCYTINICSNLCVLLAILFWKYIWKILKCTLTCALQLLFHQAVADAGTIKIIL